ncbi:hypothetical protein [Nocardia sp. NPDC003963]
MDEIEETIELVGILVGIGAPFIVALVDSRSPLRETPVPGVDGRIPFPPMMRSLWLFPERTSPGRHFAVFPKLTYRRLLAQLTPAMDPTASLGSAGS